MTATPETLFDYAHRNAILAAHEKAQPSFVEQAREFVLKELRHGPLSGEELTDRCKLAGIKPANDKAFGAVYAGLSRRKLIEVDGYCARTKGNLTAGGIRWRLAR